MRDQSASEVGTGIIPKHGQRVEILLRGSHKLRKVNEIPTARGMKMIFVINGLRLAV